MPEQTVSNKRVLIITLMLTTVCAVLVTSASILLKPRQQAWLAIEQNRSIVAAGGLSGDVTSLSPGDIVALFSDLEVQLIELKSGEPSISADPITYDFFDAINEQGDPYQIPPGLDLAQLGVRPREAPVYLLREGRELKRIVLPFYGSGMWSTISGYVALDSDLNTIASIYFYRHGETPGIGDQIEHKDWRNSWAGKQVRDENGLVQLRVTQGESTNTRFDVDGISGATVTSAAVVSMLRYWLGDDGYGPYLERLMREER